MATSAEPAANTERYGRDVPWWRCVLGRAAECSALCGVAVVQPVLGPLGESPESFVALGATSRQIIAFGLAVALGPPLVLALVALVAAGLGERLSRWVHLGMLGALAAAIGVIVARDLGAGSVLRLLAGLALGAGLVVVYLRWPVPATFLRFASPAPIVLLGVFLFVSPTSALVSQADTDAGAQEAISEAGEHPPVVMIVFDELPTRSLLGGNGEIDAGLFPNFARLAETSTWYRDATTVSASTPSAMPALLTGVMPENEEGWDAPADSHPNNIFTLLGETHTILAHEWITAMCPPGLCREPSASPAPAPEAEPLLAAGPRPGRGVLRTLVEEGRELWWTSAWPFAEHRVTDHILPGVDDVHGLAGPGIDFLSSMVATDPWVPTFEYFHAPVPHQPWLLVESGRHYQGPRPVWGVDSAAIGDEDPNPRWLPGDTGGVLAEGARVRHLVQLQWTDRLLGAFIDRLQSLQRWDEAVVVVTADHGFAFGEGEHLRILGPGNQLDLAWVPLFIKAPGQTTAEVLDDNVLLIDVLSTVAEMVGVEPSWDVDGISLVGDETRSPGVKPMLSHEPERFHEQGPGDVVMLDPDGLDELLALGPLGSGEGPLRAWRYGEHGELVGREVAELGVCGEDQATRLEIDLAVGDDGSVELWTSGIVEAGEEIDLVVATGGIVAGWTRSHTDGSGANRFGLLLAEPIAAGSQGPVEVYEIRDGDNCRLAAVAALGQ